MSDTISIIPVRTPALGDTSYIVSDAEVAVVVDPQRDLDRFETPINRLGVDIGAILETHVHNDYVSGGPELARRSGARMIVPAAAAPSFRSEPAFHREPLTVGSMVLLPIHTPGHTPEHTSYVLIVEGREIAVFSGGSLLVGAAGRSDLLGPARAETLSRLQFRSVNALASLPEDVQLHPTHGQGSFCAAGTGGTTSSTIGQERASNPVLQIPTEDAFIADQLEGLPSYPAYYRYMAPMNLAGATEMPGEAPEIEADRLSSLLETVTVVDARSREAFAAGHIPGSLWVGTGDSFSSWVGWLTDIDDPLVLIVDRSTDVRQLQIELARIGYDRVVGWMSGLERWSALGGALSSMRIVTLDEWVSNPPEQILDVRDYWEHDETPLASAIEVHLPDIDEAAASALDRTRPVGVVCASGYRATIAASILERHGLTSEVLTDKGATELSKLDAAGT